MSVSPARKDVSRWRVFRRRLLTFLSFAFLAAGLLASASVVAPSAATGAALAETNPIVAENENPGTAAWRIGTSPYRVADDANSQIKGYASATSVEKGAAIDFKVSVNPAQQYTIDIYRLGCYPNAAAVCLGGRLMTELGPLDGVKQPDCAVDGPTGGNTGLTQCQWSGPTFTIPEDWTSGIYVAVLTNAADYQNYIQFVVRDDERHAALLYQQPVLTYEAYNNYPNYGSNDSRNGKSAYDNKSGGDDTVAGAGRKRAVKLSFDRPYANTGADDLMDANGWSWELYFIHWLEKSGYDVSYTTNVDTHERPGDLLAHRAFVSVGHDEYWSKAMFDAAEAARDAGVNLAFFGANDVYWQVRMEPSSGGTPNRVMVVYKNTPNNSYDTVDPVGDPSLRTVRFQDPPVNRPSQSLLGLSFLGSTERSTKNSAHTVVHSDNWVYAGTGFTDGSTVPGIVGYEADKYSCMYAPPVYRTYTILSSSRFVDGDGYADYSNASLYQAPSGAWVFASGTMSWPWALDRDTPAPDQGLPGGWVDPRLQKATSNILDVMTGATAAGPVANDVPPCVEQRLMTFEGGALNGPYGADKALGSVSLESSNAIKGAHSARLAAVGNSYLDERTTAVDDLNLSFYVRLNALPAGDVRMALAYSGITSGGNLVVRANGAVCLRNGNAWVGGSPSTACSATPLAVGTTYRLRLHQVRGTGGDAILEGFVAAGDAAFGAPFAKTTTGPWTTAADRVSVGSTTSAVIDAAFDDIRIDGGPLALPAAPSGLTATASTSRTAIDLLWVDNASSETAYVVERSTTSAFGSLVSFRVPADATSFSDTTTAPSTTYFYRVKAVNSSGESAYSGVATATTRSDPPAAPTNLSATVLSQSSTRLDWADRSSNEESFVVERSSTSSFAAASSFTLPANTVTWTDSGLADGAYWYRVKAVNAGIGSAYSNAVHGPRLKDITFEDGTVSLVNSGTGAEKNPGGLVKRETAAPLKGAYSARVPNVANAYLEQSFAGLDDVWVSFYFRLAARPTSDYRIAQILSGPTTIANVWVRMNGTLCLKYGNYWSGGSSTTACTSSPLALAPTTYRIAVHQVAGNGTSNALVAAYLATGDAPFAQDANGATPFAASSIAPAVAGYWQTQATILRFGATLSTVPLDATFDDVKLDSAYLPPPSTGS